MTRFRIQNLFLPSMAFAPLCDHVHSLLPSALHSWFHSSLLSVFALLFICCCLSICAAIFICLKPITCVDAHVFLLPVSVMDALRIRTASFGSLLPTVFIAASLNSLHCQLHLLLPSTFGLCLVLHCHFSLSLPLALFCGQFHMLLPLAPIFIHFCPWSFVPPVLLTATLVR